MLNLVDSLPTVRSAILVNRTVFANFETSPTAPFELSMQSARSPFIPCDAAMLENFSFVRREELPTDSLNTAVRTQPAEKHPGEVAALWVNHLMDWALPGTQTLQLMIARRELPCRIDIDRPIVVDADDTALCFHALLATHRAHARMKVKFLHVDSGLVSERRIDFDPSAHGGCRYDGYQHVSIPLPAGGGRFEIRLSVSYDGYADDGTESEPFLFLSDVHVGPERPIVSNGLLNPQMLVGDKIPSDGIWMSAQLPAIPGPEAKIKSALMAPVRVLRLRRSSR